MTALITLTLAVVALVILPQNAAGLRCHTSAPRPWVVLVVTSIALAGLACFARTALALQPAFAHWPLVLVPTLGALAVIVVMTWLLCQWAATSDWNDRHRLALVVGDCSPQPIRGAILTKTMVDRAGVAVLILVTLVCLILFASKVRDRTRRQRGDPDGAEPTQF